MSETGPIYGVELLNNLPLDGGMRQALPSRRDLEDVRRVSDRTVAGFEVLTEHYRRAMNEIERLNAENERLKGEIINGDQVITTLSNAVTRETNARDAAVAECERYKEAIPPQGRAGRTGCGPRKTRKTRRGK